MTQQSKEELQKKDRRDFRALAAFMGVTIAGISWILFGPIGLFIGGSCGIAAALKFIKSADKALEEEAAGAQQGTSQSDRNQSNGFQFSLLILTSMVMRADGHITRGELDEFKQFWKSSFGESQTLQALQLLKQMVQRDSDYIPICRQISQHLSYSARLELLHFLLRIAAADYIAGSEVNLIGSMAGYLGISRADYLSILQAYMHRNNASGSGYNGKYSDSSQGSGYRSQSASSSGNNLQWAYQLLQIDETATNEEVKKAYRRMAMKYHPDKVASLGEGVRQSATEKFKEVGKAYESIKQSRGIN